MIIAIDGPSGSGKSSTAKAVAKRMGIVYLNTGAMYRAITFKALQQKITLSSINDLSNLVQNTSFDYTVHGDLLVDGLDLGDDLIKPEVSAAVSSYCQIPVVRQSLTNKQRQFGETRSCILDGRDIGTVVFPNAQYKFFLVADYRVRAQRRQAELASKGIKQDLEEIESNLRARDEADSTRKEAPLIKAEDAITIDTTQLSFEQQVECICAEVGVVTPEQTAITNNPGIP